MGRNPKCSDAAFLTMLTKLESLARREERYNHNNFRDGETGPNPWSKKVEAHRLAIVAYHRALPC